MAKARKPLYEPGRNIAMKVPPHQWAATVQFYHDTLGLRLLPQYKPHTVFAFGDKNLWIDRVESISQAELWLEIRTTHIKRAAANLAKHKIVRCDEIEKLPDGLKAFWIASPASIVHLVVEDPM